MSNCLIECGICGRVLEVAEFQAHVYKHLHRVKTTRREIMAKKSSWEEVVKESPPLVDIRPPLAQLRDVLPDCYGRKEHAALMEAHRFRERLANDQKTEAGAILWKILTKLKGGE